jgi:hypothetical protein
MHFLVFDTKFRGGIFCELKKKFRRKFRYSGPEFRLLGTASFLIQKLTKLRSKFVYIVAVDYSHFNH